MRIRHFPLLLLLSQCAAADVFVLQLNDTSPGIIINTTGTRCNGSTSCILDAPEPGLYYLPTGLHGTFLFAEPGDDNIVGSIQFLLNDGPIGAATEIYLPTTDPGPGDPARFFDFTTFGGCSSVPSCTPGTQNGTEYYLGTITYTDGETDSFYFEWIVSGLPIVAPEPTSLVLLATLGAIIGIRRSR